MMRSWKCFSHVSKIPTLTYNPAHIIRNSIILNIIHNILTLCILVLSKRGGPGGSMSQVVGSDNSYKSITNTAWICAQLCKLQKGCTRLTAASDKVYQLLVHGRWFSPGTPASSTTKTGRHDIAEILLKVALNTKIQIQIQIISKRACSLNRHLVVCLFCLSSSCVLCAQCCQFLLDYPFFDWAFGAL